MPSPFAIIVRYWHEDYSQKAYSRLAHFLEHLAEILAREARALVETGVDVVQLDEDRLNLEFAYPGIVDVSGLERLPAHLSIGMGVIDVRSERVQSVEEIKALGTAGAQILRPERIGVSGTP